MKPAPVLPLVVELEIWAPPGASGVPFDGKKLAERCRIETSLASTVVLGLNFVPALQDVLNLEAALKSGVVKLSDFMNFCAQRDLSQDLRSERSAAEFLAFTEGQALAWLHMPAENSGLAMSLTVFDWAQRNALQIRDGDQTNEVLSEAQIISRWSRNA